MQKLKIVWDKQAVIQFSEAIEYICKDSPQNAMRIKKDITNMIQSLLKYPEKHSPDKYKADNPNNTHRAFEKHRLRISYQFYDNIIRIIRVRHTSQNPQSY